MNVNRMVLVAIAALVLGGCDTATSGKIMVKEHQPEYVYYSTDCVFYSTINNVSMCMAWASNQHVVPECYYLGFYNEQEDENGTVCLPRETWDRYTEGGHYPDPR